MVNSLYGDESCPGSFYHNGQWTQGYWTSPQPENPLQLGSTDHSRLDTSQVYRTPAYESYVGVEIPAQSRQTGRMHHFAHRSPYGYASTNLDSNVYTASVYMGEFPATGSPQTNELLAHEPDVSYANDNMTQFQQQTQLPGSMPTNAPYSDNEITCQQNQASLGEQNTEWPARSAPDRLSADTDPYREKYFALWRSMLRITGNPAANGNEDDLRASRITTWRYYLDGHDKQRRVRDFIVLVQMIYLEHPKHFKVYIEEHGEELEKLYASITALLPAMRRKAKSLGQRKPQKGRLAKPKDDGRIRKR